MVASESSVRSASDAEHGVGQKHPLNESRGVGDYWKYWSYTSTHFLRAVDQSNATFATLLSSLYNQGDQLGDDESRDLLMPLPSNKKPDSLKYPEISWLLKNPYSSVRGRHQSPQSLSAVRSLLSLLPVERSSDDMGTSEKVDMNDVILDESIEEFRRNKLPRSSASETASQLAEGTLRALRDLELEEAIELHRSLRFWTNRWERPVLSWLEAGPWVWMSEEGYNHQSIGQKVSQIQAVLARRVGTIGELQQHLLRAGWQKGVASWAVLGEGGQWTAVAGFDGGMSDDPSECSLLGKQRRLSEFENTDIAQSQSSLIGLGNSGSFHKSLDDQDPNSASQSYYGNADVFVDRQEGGKIQTDDPAIAAWSVDAMRLVRIQLHRAGKGLIQLPYVQNWFEDAPTSGVVISPVDESARPLPKWASVSHAATFEHVYDNTEAMEQSTFRVEPERNGKIEIIDVPLMAAEVSEILNSMEVVMQKQRHRRLRTLKAMPGLRRNWYAVAAGTPIVTYIMYKLLRNGYGKELAQFVIQKVKTFCEDHVWAPLRSIGEELFSRKERESISDHEARVEVIESLKKMIRSWLDETFPDMHESEKSSRAERMDMSLIEQKKEANMKTIYELNSVVRMSFIEMQFIKKEMMNALYAMDEMMMSNEINMNLAAVTPAVILLYTVRHAFRFMWYALLQLGKSKEESYAQFRRIMLNIERLLVMRDSPPRAPPPVDGGEPLTFHNVEQHSVLNADDLGMLMLHVYECRNILWHDHHRFSPQLLRDVGEDLAELAGERGPVSVKQQVQILARMYRTHPFMKVVSTGIPFDLLVSGNQF